MAFNFTTRLRQTYWFFLVVGQKFTELMGMWATTAKVTRVMGEQAAAWGEYEQAEKILKTGIELAARKKEPRQDMLAMTALDELYDQTREYEKRFQILLKKIEVRKRLNDIMGQTEDLSKITSGFLSCNRYDRALNYSQKALELCPADAPIQFQVHLRIHSASVMSYMGKIKQAEKTLQEAIDIATKNQEKSQIAFAQHELGLLYVRNSRPEEAANAITDALKAIKGTNNDILEAIFLDDLGEIYTQLKKYRKAIPVLEQALTRWKRGINSNNSVITCKKLARLHCKCREFETAFELLGDMVKFCQMTGRYQASEELKAEAKELMKLSPDSQQAAGGFERMIGDALVSELSGRKAVNSRRNLLHRMRQKVTQVTNAPKNGSTEREDLPVKVYELSERYVKSIMRNVRRK